MNQERDAADSAQTTGAQAWLTEIRIVQAWIEAHPVLLGGSAILVPSISVYHYTAAEHIPLSIASPDIISALPSVLAAIAFLILALAALPLIPVSLMFEGATRDADGRLRVLSRDLAKRKKDALHWLSTFSLPGIIIALGVATNVFWFPDSSWPVTGAAVIACLIFTWLVRQKKSQGLHDLISEGTYITLLISLLQMLIAIYTMQASLRIFGKSPSDFQVFLALTLALVGLPLLQLLVVTLIELTSQRYGFVNQAFLGALCLISAMCIIPTTGAFLAGHVIGGSASGYTKCTQLRLAQDKDFAELLVPGSHSTIPLRILSNAAGIYLARKSDSVDETVYRIPEASVVALSPCPSEKRRR